MKLKVNRNVCKAACILVVALLIGVLLLKLLSEWETRHDIVDVLQSNEPNDGRLYLDGKCYVPNKDLEAVLLIGVDKYEAQTQGEGYNNTQQSDFLLLLLMDKQSKTCKALHINRDTMTDIPVLGVRGEKAGTIKGQLALAHTYGSGGLDSCRNTVEAVSNLLYGVKIDHYIAFTMDAVAKINDLAGGVTVTVQDDMTSVSPDMYKGATVTLNGDMALAYVRARGQLEDSSNLRRMERQRQYMKELRSAMTAKTESDETFILKALNSVSKYMTSDCTINQLSRMYDHWKIYADSSILTMEGEAKKGAEFMEFYPDDNALRQLVANLFYIPIDE